MKKKEAKIKIILKIIALIFAVLPLSIAIANEDIVGTWQGNLTIGPDRQMTVQFIISQTLDGSYAAVLNTPLEGNINNISADRVSYFAGNLKIDVLQLSGSYNGDVKDGKIEGEWKQERTSYPLILRKPTLSKEDMEMLLGEWHGKPIPEVPEGLPDRVVDTNTYLFRFEMSEQGEFKGYYAIPDYGFPDEPLTDMGVSDGIFYFKIRGGRQFTGKLTSKEIAGKLENIYDVNSSSQSLTLVRGGYKAPVYNLVLPEEIKDQLAGAWNGTLTMKLPMVVVFHFETSKEGEFSGFMETPEEGASVCPVTDAYMSNGKVVLYVERIGWRFSGKISSDKFVVDWTSTVSGTPIIFKRGEYIEPEYNLTLTEETMAQLEGKWIGKFRGFNSTFRFKKEKNGEFKGFANIPVIGPKEKSISDASLSKGKLTFKIKNRIPVEFTGELSGNELIGELKMPWGDGSRLSLEKEKTDGKRQIPPWEKTSNEEQGKR